MQLRVFYGPCYIAGVVVLQLYRTDDLKIYKDYNYSAIPMIWRQSRKPASLAQIHLSTAARVVQTAEPPER